MISSLRLNNYRCFNEHEVTFCGTNVVVGANNAGKSTLVESLRLLSLVVGRYKGLAYVRPPEWTSLPARLVGVCPAMGSIDLRGGSVFFRYGSPPAIVKACFSNGTAVEVHVGPDNRVFGNVFDANGQLVTTKGQARNVEIPTIAILPQIGPLVENEPLLTDEHVVSSIDTNLASRHFRNQLYHLQGTYYETFKERAESSWPQLHLESLNVEGSPGEQVLSFHIRDKNFVAEVGWMGHGLQMWLQTMWFLARSGHASTVILDEPDVYMHADLQRRLIRLLRGSVGQTIIATHSVEIMSEVAPENILIVDKSRSRSGFASSLPVVQRTIDRLGGVHNIHLARLWGSRRCLHVEGKDIAFLKAFQDILFPQSHAPMDVMPRLSLGGWSGWPYAIGSAMSLTNSAGESIMSYCVLDSDYHTEDELSERYEEADRHGVQLHIWHKKEIENYLLVPTAIARVIASGNSLSSPGPTAEEVQAKIDEIATGMKDGVFDSLSHEYIVIDKSGGVSRANPRARQRLDAAWQSREGRWSIIPGKDTIAALSEWSKTSFGVSFGAMRIAREIRIEEVDPEMKAVIKSIERLQHFPDHLTRKKQV